MREAFGGRTGFLAVWCDYAENIPWFPTVLSFMAASLAYVVNPALASNKVYLVVVMLVMFWGATLVNLRGSAASTWLGGVGTIAGSILPAVLVVGLGIAWLTSGDGSEIPFSAHALAPEISFGNLAFLGGIILLFSGMEMAGFHARETENPGRDVPRALALSVVIIVTFSILGSLFLAFIVPAQNSASSPEPWSCSSARSDGWDSGGCCGPRFFRPLCGRRGNAGASECDRPADHHCATEWDQQPFHAVGVNAFVECCDPHGDADHGVEHNGGRERDLQGSGLKCELQGGLADVPAMPTPRPISAWRQCW